jgi:hypothetical protein
MDKADERPGKGNGDRAVIDHVAKELIDRGATTDEPMVHSPTTGDGKSIEKQVQKQWDPKKKGGLPTFFK